MKTTQTNTETNNTKKEIFLTKEIREKLISDLLDSQQKLAFYIRNRQEFPDRNYRNFLMDREEDNIYKISQILINNKF
jgi:hypothetical protein